MLAFGGVFIKSQNERGRNPVNDFRRGKSEHLLFKNMVEPLVVIGIKLFHFFAVKQAFDDFRDIQSRFHIQVDERVIWIVKTPRIFVFEQIDHFPNDLFRCKDLVVFLRRNIVENIFRVRVVKNDHVEQVPVKVPFFSRFFVDVIAVVAWLLLRVADKLAAVLGQTGLNILGRLCGMLLSALGIEFIYTSLRAMFPAWIG